MTNKEPKEKKEKEQEETSTNKTDKHRRLDPTRYGDWEKNGRCIDF